ncbi:MAG: phage protease [Opitutaceae bacterium]|nr:phage protease [Opitutaceae bacterium]
MKTISLYFRPLLMAANEAVTFRWVGAANELSDAGHSWFRLSPYGDYPVNIAEHGRRRRVIQRIDRAAADEMIAAFNSLAGRAARLFRGLPVYIGHPDDPEWKRENPGIPAQAQGRVKELQARADGLYGRIALNAAGAALISGEAAPYDAQSPHWGMIQIAEGIYRPVKLFSIGLTNHPNIPDTAIGLNEAAAAESSATMKEQLLKLLAALGLTVAADADDAKVTSAANEALLKAQAALAAQGELTTAKTQLAAAANEKAALQGQLVTVTNEAATAKTRVTTLESQVAAEREARAEAVLTRAVNEGRIAQAQRPEWKSKLIAAPDFASTEGELGKLKKTVNTQSRVADLGARKAEQAASAETIRAINDAVAKKQKETGCSHRTAYQAIRQEKPELFAAGSD